MNISKKEVEHIAVLSRLKLSEKETGKLSRELTAILGYIDKLKELKVDNTAARLQPSGQDLKARNDEVLDFADKEKILKNAPKVTNNFIEVKGVFK